jgi:ABC-type sugar transport system substrate-binding protein
MAPVEELIVATAGFDEVQLPPKTVDEKVTESPMQMFCVPDKVPAETGAVTVTVLVAVAFGQPPEPKTIYVMVEVPAATPTITPVELLMVATAGFDEVQVPPKTVEAKVTESPMQMFCVPDKVPAETGAVTVTVLVAVAFGQPPEPKTIYVMVEVPAVTPTIAPVELLIVAAAGFDDIQVPPETVETKVTESPMQIF